MNKIDPFTVLLLAVAIFLSSFVLLKQSNEELIQSNIELKEFNIVANEYINLKSTQKTKNKTLKLIDKIIKSLGVKNVDKKVQDKNILVKLNNISLKKIDKFTNKILNQNLNILKLNITKNSVELVVGY